MITNLNINEKNPNNNNNNIVNYFLLFIINLFSFFISINIFY